MGYRLLCVCGALSSVLGVGSLGCGTDAKTKAGDAGTSHDAAATRDASTAPQLGSDPTKVTLADGKLEGDVMGDSVRFLRIPYAKPPMDALRWKAPEDNVGWKGVRHETEFASPCPQPPSQQSPASTNEDCLYLNVWRPNDTKPGAPVMVWIHGGGFTTGSTADILPLTTDHLWYDGQAFAERGVVLVL